MSGTTRIAQTALAIPFIVLGVQTVTNPGPRLGAAKRLGLPAPRALVRLTGMAMIVGGGGLVLNRCPRAAAVGLAASLIPTTAGQHRFWEEPAGRHRQEKLVNFVKNMGLFGGLLKIATR